MSSYTKYHKKYREQHKDKINAYKKKKYHEQKHGIPLDMYDTYAIEPHRKYYIKFNKMLSELNVELLRVMINNYVKNN